ncbi:MAG TPA: sucrase ferredoxin [Candidatus Cybelea sp.]
MTNGSAFRCAVAAETRGDPMIGTAPPQTRLLLVHQPGGWGPRGLVESRCDPEVARRIDAAAADAGMRLQAIRLPGRHDAAATAGGYDVAIADTRSSPATTTWWRVRELAEIAAELETGGPHRRPVAIDTAPLYLVCTHGRHDACCALRGRPVAQALQQIRPDRVWETTHLGGDRFAANLLILPTGELYGRVPAQLAAELVERTDAGELLPSLLRGRIGLAPVVQAALAFAHQQLNVVERDALTVGSIRWLENERAEVEVIDRRHRSIVTVETTVSRAAALTCRGPENARAREYRGVRLDSAV